MSIYDDPVKDYLVYYIWEFLKSHSVSELLKVVVDAVAYYTDKEE